MLVGPTGDTAPAGGAGEKTHLHQIGLIDVLEGNCLLIDGSRQGLQAHRPAGKLIDDAGLRGYRVGNVMVSEKHCGFVVNMGGGTCEEAKAVINHVREEVEKQFGVTLEMEVRKLGWN